MFTCTHSLVWKNRCTQFQENEWCWWTKYWTTFQLLVGIYLINVNIAPLQKTWLTLNFFVLLDDIFMDCFDERISIPIGLSFSLWRSAVLNNPTVIVMIMTMIMYSRASEKSDCRVPPDDTGPSANWCIQAYCDY